MNRKTLLVILTLLTAAFVVTIGSSVFATGWNTVDETTGPTGAGGVHMGFTTGSNKCKSCHAVHGAGAGSYRLLHNNSRDTECNYCHYQAGTSGMQVYDVVGWQAGSPGSGEHTVAAIDSVNAPAEGTVIPDSTATVPVRAGDSGKFNCFHCHTVHGANRVELPSELNDKIVRKQPIPNGPIATDEGSYCGACHNSNSKTDGSSHPMRAPAGTEVYGETLTVAWGDATNCNGCHAASKGYGNFDNTVTPPVTYVGSYVETIGANSFKINGIIAGADFNYDDGAGGSPVREAQIGVLDTITNTTKNPDETAVVSVVDSVTNTITVDNAADIATWADNNNLIISSTGGESEYPHQSTGPRFLFDGADVTGLDDVCLACHNGPGATGVGESF